MRYKYRITKYDPAKRNFDGIYTVDEWTSFSDIGKIFQNQPLTRLRYLKTEKAYLQAILLLLQESDIHTLTLCQLENRTNFSTHKLSLANGAILNRPQILTFAQLALREKIWGKLFAPRQAYIHFGWDYYLYVGVPKQCPDAIKMISELGLFIEAKRSPYLKNNPTAIAPERGRRVVNMPTSHGHAR